MKTLLEKAYRGWMRFAHALGTINGAIIFTLIFYVVLGLYALPLKVVRLFRPAPRLWERKPARPATLEELRRQF